MALQELEFPTHIVLIEHIDDFAFRADSFIGLNGEFQGRQRVALVVDYPATQPAGYERPCNLKRLPVATCCDQANPRTRSGQYSVGGNGRAVHDMTDFTGIYSGAARHAFNAVEYTK